jgi:hypothetical protein
MTPADFFYLATGSCTIVLTVLTCALLLILIMAVRGVQRKIEALRVPERRAVISPWAVVVQDIVHEGISWFKERYGEKPKE